VTFMCLPLFDRMPVSRDRDCCSLLKISEFFGWCQGFGRRHGFDHFKHSGLVQ
jgi:hypothetical protein